MALFGRDYDRDYGRPYGSSTPRGGRSFWGGSGHSIQPNYEDDYGWRGRGRDTGWFSPRDARYGGDYGAGRGYDQPYKSRWQTDYGDPFGDREQQTPMRVIRGEPRRYDRGFWTTRYGSDYGYDTSGYSTGMWRDRNRGGYDAGYNQRTFRTYDRSYDDDWF